jgi:hypothetical protein
LPSEFERNTGKPLDKFVDRGSVPEIFKQGPHGNSASYENVLSSANCGILHDGGAIVPIHGVLFPMMLESQSSLVHIHPNSCFKKKNSLGFERDYLIPRAWVVVVTQIA